MAELTFHRKEGKLRRKVVLWSLVLLLLGGALISAFYFVLYSDFFNVQDFEISGARFTAKETLLAALKADMLGRSKLLAMLGPPNLLFWEFSRKPETLASLPLLAKLSINTDLTSKKILIEVEERDFFGIWCRGQDDCYAFDREGIVFARAPRAEGALVLKIYDENSRPLVLGEAVFPKTNWRENVFKTLEILRNHNLVISRVRVKDFSLEEWEAETVLRSGAVGAGPNFQFSLNFIPQNLARILDNLDDKFEFDKVTYFDFRVENRIYYK